jgi:neutral amino acid transport system ATP-binding protein
LFVTALRTEDVSKHFGGFEVVRGCSIEVKPGEIVGLIGPNGAGKTTLFNIISGALPPDRGDVIVRDTPIAGWPSDRVARLGLVRTHQIARPFARLSVIENLLVAAPRQTGESIWAVWRRDRRVQREEGVIEQLAWGTLSRLKLDQLANAPASSLSGGQRKLLELGRCLMADPSVLLLDEPVAGVSAGLADQIAGLIQSLRDEGRTFLIVEHKMEFIMRLCGRVYVMANGAIVASGSPKVIRNDESVLRAYLGELDGEDVT